MAIEIIDGVGPQNHVTSDQVGLSQAGTIGTGAIILPVGQQLGYEIVSNNQVNIKDGVYVIQGKRGWIRPGTVEQCTIQTGNNGQYRNDLICIKYTKNAQSKLEEFSIAVVKGTPGASGADPTYTTGDINDGALESYAPIYRVRLNGINIIGVDLMASKVSSLLETAGKIGNLNDLATSAKTSLVAAANELQAAITALNGNLQPSELLTWADNDAGVTIRGKYNGIAVTYFFSGALKASISAWGSLNVSAESNLKPSVTSFVRLSADLYGVIDINGKISIYNGSSEPILENSNKELNGVLTYIL